MGSLRRYFVSPCSSFEMRNFNICNNVYVHPDGIDLLWHVPGLQALSIMSGRQFLEEFGTHDSGGDAGELARSRLSFNLRNFVDRFFHDLVSSNLSALDDVVWIKINKDLIGTNLEFGANKVLDFDSSADVYLSILSHIKVEIFVENSNLGEFILVVTKRVLSSWRSYVPKLKKVLTHLSSRMRDILNYEQWRIYMSYSLLAYPDADMRAFLESIGASVDVAMNSNPFKVDKCLIAAGTGQLHYTKEHFGTGLGTLWRCSECLDAAALSNSVDIVSYILDNSDLNDPTIISEFTRAFNSALCRGSLGVCSLISSKLQANLAIDLNLLGRLNDVRTASYLVGCSGGNFPEIIDLELGYCTITDDIDVMQYLLSLGSKFYTHAGGNNPVTEAVSSRCSLGVIQFILDNIPYEMSQVAKADILNAISILSAKKDGALLRLLLESVDVQDVNTYDIVKKFAGNIGSTRLLLRKGVDVNIKE